MLAIPALEIASPAVMEQSPVVSVVMLTRDHEPYLEAAVSSVMNQRLQGPLELLIGEDGSSDGTLALARRLVERWPLTIRLIHAATTVGIRDNFLRLLGRARAPLIALLEGDDYWVCDNKLSLQASLLRDDPALSCAGGVTLNRPPLGPLPPRDRFALAELLRRYRVHSSSLLFWRDLAVPFPNVPDGALDSMLLTLLASRGDCGWVAQPLSYYRRHDGGYWSGADRQLRLQRSLVCIGVMDGLSHGRFGRELAARELWIHQLDWPLPAQRRWSHWRQSLAILRQRGLHLLVWAPLGCMQLALWTALQPLVMVGRLLKRQIAILIP